MKEIKKESHRALIFSATLVLVFLVIRYWEKLEGLFFLAISAAMPLIIGCVLAYVINILMRCYENWYDKLFKVDVAKKAKRIVCLILAFLSLIGIIVLVVNLVLPELINCIASFIRLIPGVFEMVVNFVGKDQILQYFPELKNGFDITSLSAEVETLIKSVLGGVGGALGSIMTAVTSAANVVVNFVIGLIFSLYLLIEKEKLGAQCKRLIETYLPKIADKIFYVTEVFDSSFSSFIVGQCTEAVVLGGLCIIGMLIFQFPYAVMIGVFIGFTALIPIAGAYIGAAVGVIMILTVSPLKAIQFLVFILILQQIEGNLIYPKVVGKSIGLPGIWVLTAVTVGGGLLGVGGMLLAVPTFAALYRLLKEDVERRNPQVEPEIKDKIEDKNESVFVEEDEE